MNKTMYFLTLAVLLRDKYEWKLIEVNYEHEFMRPTIWLTNYWKAYENYKKVVVVDDNVILEVFGNDQNHTKWK